jgi:hypothetical protein
MIEQFTCVLCKKDIENEHGNNPQPLSSSGKCCINCNIDVIVARLEIHKNSTK